MTKKIENTLFTKASAELQEEIEDELQKEDPPPEQAQAILNKKENHE